MDANWISAWANVGAAIATIAAVCVARRELESWKERHETERRSQLRHDVGRRYRVVVFKLRDEITRGLRQSYIAEPEQAIPSADDDAVALWRRDFLLREWAGIKDRLNDLQAELDSLRYEVEAAWVPQEDMPTLGLEVLILRVANRYNSLYLREHTKSVRDTVESYVDESGQLLPEIHEELKGAVADALRAIEGPIRD